ncbi:MAG: hypothetical protein NVSMB9_18420 [Isosphaeraceae bacterium]
MSSAFFAACLCPIGGSVPGAEPVARATVAEDSRTFRATVIVRKGNGQGSGTIIASVSGETLVLTAAHVVKDTGPIVVELHRYNLGVERALSAKGWPLEIPARLAAEDRAADLAIVRVPSRPALPFVASLASPGDEPSDGALLTSLGIDGGNTLRSWTTRLRQVAWFRMGTERTGGEGFLLSSTLAKSRNRARRATFQDERPYLITNRAPEQGRSGGGLFVEQGKLVGVCVGRIDLAKGKTWGIFSSVESVRRLLREHDLDGVVARSEAARGENRTRSSAP